MFFYTVVKKLLGLALPYGRPQVVFTVIVYNVVIKNKIQ